MKLPMVLSALVVAAALTACSSTTPATSTAPGDQQTNPSAAAQTGLAAFGLTGKSTREVVDALDRTNEDRAVGLRASVQQDRVLVTDGRSETSMPMPAEHTYVAIAPYRNKTHECFNHNLATCQGELATTSVKTTITKADGTVVLDRDEQTYPNGFVGFWVPRNISGTIRVNAHGMTGTIAFATDPSAPTCLTTLKLT